MKAPLPSWKKVSRQLNFTLESVETLVSEVKSRCSIWLQEPNQITANDLRFCVNMMG